MTHETKSLIKDATQIFTIRKQTLGVDNSIGIAFSPPKCQKYSKSYTMLQVYRKF